MSYERVPLLPPIQKELEDSSPVKRERTISKAGSLLGLCVCLVLLGVWTFFIGSEESSETTTNLLGPLVQNKALNFLVVGDWGRHGLYNQSLVAAQMGKIGEKLGIRFVISTGDNFYDTGLNGVNDPAFTSSFTDIYTAASLQTTWYAVLGNHDYMGDAVAQLSGELLNRDSRWSCRRTFQLNYTLCNGFNEGLCSSSLDMFFFDTTPFVDKYWNPNNTESFNWTGLAPRSEQLQSQLDELRQALNSSTATWKVVVGHHTIRSIGHHGDTNELVEKLTPILEEYRVDVYINGHDHNLQHIKRADSIIHFFTSGGGSKAYRGLSSYTEEQGVLFADDGQGFLAVSISSMSVAFTFYNVFGESTYNFLLQK